MEHITAKVSCFARAYHLKNNKTCVFCDDAAETLLGNDYRVIADNLKQGASFFLPDFSGSSDDALRLITERQLAPSVLARSAFCENALENEISLGTKQYVIFASGFDTWGIRNSKRPISVFELDLPEMIKDKNSRIASANCISSSVFVPCNLSDTAWIYALEQSGLDKKSKVFGSLLGISYYLDSAEFSSLLKNISRIFTEGSALCFDYPMKNGGKETQINSKLASGAGEPMKSEYTYGEIEKLLSDTGFLIYEHLDSKEATDRFFTKYNASNPKHPMYAPEGVGYCLAVKKNF